MKKDEDNLDIVFIGGCLVLMVVAIGITLSSSFNPVSNHKDAPLWLQLTGDETSLTIKYNATDLVGFQKLTVKGTWLDPETQETRILYESSSRSLTQEFKFPKLVSSMSPTMTVDTAVEVSEGETSQTIHYLWSITNNVYAKPTIKFLR